MASNFRGWHLCKIRRSVGGGKAQTRGLQDFKRTRVILYAFIVLVENGATEVLSQALCGKQGNTGGNSNWPAWELSK